MDRPVVPRVPAPREALLEALAEATSDVLLVTDPDGRYLWINEAGAALVLRVLPSASADSAAGTAGTP